jgi:hypothetical protein
MQEHVRKQFSARLFEPADLVSAIDDARVGFIAQRCRCHQWPSIHSMFNSDDQLQAAVMIC